MKRTTTPVHGTATQNTASDARELPAIFGLRYIEEEATEIKDVIGCLRAAGSCTSCDDVDYIV